MARTAGEGNPDAIQGFHSERLLLLIADEASAISDAVFERGMGALTDTHTIAVLCGNPTKLGTFFHRTQTDLRGDPWHCIKVSSFDVPGSEGYIDLIRKTYGDGSSAWKVRVLGEFPDSNDDALIARDALEAALGREVQGTDVQPVAGVDVARFGSDANCFVLRQGNRILMPPIEWRGLDLMATTGKVIDIINGLHPDQRPVGRMINVT